MDLSIIIPKKHYHTNNLYFEFVKEDKYMYLFDKEQLPFYYTTPMLKVFKSIHEFNNDYYLVLSLDNEDDANNDIYNFKTRMDRIYGKAQDEVKKNYKEIFPNLKGYIDQVTYETCIKRPYTGSRGQLMKILIPDDNDALFKRLEGILEGQHLQCNIMYKGLKKVSGGRMIEEYILVDFITEDEWMSEVTKKMINPYGTKFNVEVIKEDIKNTTTSTSTPTPTPTEINEEILERTNISEFVTNNVNDYNETNDFSNNNNYNSFSNCIIDNSNIGDNVEVETIIEEMNGVEGGDGVEGEKDEKGKRGRKPKSGDKEKENKRKLKEKEKKKKMKEEWLKQKTGKYESDNENEDEKDGLSDDETFRELDKEEKEKFRKLYRKLNQGKK